MRHIFATVLISVYAAAAKSPAPSTLSRTEFSDSSARAVLLQPVTVFLRSVDREYSVVDLLELAETDFVRDRQSILDQSILPMIFVISAAEKARSVSVRTLPSAPRLKFSDIAADSSGASTMVTMS